MLLDQVSFPTLVTYALLLIAVATALAGQRLVAAGLAVGAVVAGFIAHRISDAGVFWLVCAAGAGAAASYFVKSPKLGVRLLAGGAYGAFFAAVINLSLRLFPGFENLRVYDQVQFSPDSLPFSMYLNLDKTFAGLLLILFFLERTKWPSKMDWRFTGAMTAVLIVLLMPIAFLMSYVRFDTKVPPLIWMANNLFFVVMAEEALFRGLLQGGLAAFLKYFVKKRTTKEPSERMEKVIATSCVILAACLFGLAHSKGGMIYVGLATVSGIFYGVVYRRTQSLIAAMAIHFAVNLIHFAFFTYPALIR